MRAHPLLSEGGARRPRAEHLAAQVHDVGPSQRIEVGRELRDQLSVLPGETFQPVVTGLVPPGRCSSTMKSCTINVPPGLNLPNARPSSSVVFAPATALGRYDNQDRVLPLGGHSVLRALPER